MTLPGLSQSRRPIADATTLMLGLSGGQFVSAGAIVIMLGTLLTQMVGTTRLLWRWDSSDSSRRSPFRLSAGTVSALLSAALSFSLIGTATIRDILATVAVGAVGWTVWRGGARDRLSHL